jgi:16S rRNA (guanine527-N7)-methyltransferase
MPTLSESRIFELLSPYLDATPVPANLHSQLSIYLDLLLKWNARTNLTAIRDPETIVQRHFGESLFCGLEIASRLSAPVSLLDFGSGAGFPGLPIQLLFPEWRVTLGESQNKKATFLREAVRTLDLPHTEVWAARVEDMPKSRQFDVVTARAVDKMEEAIKAATPRVKDGGWLVKLSGEQTLGEENLPIPLAKNAFVTLGRPGMFHVEHSAGQWVQKLT